MTGFDKGLERWDNPEIVYRLFFPRREFVGEQNPLNAKNHFVKVEVDIAIGCRFYPARAKMKPSIFCIFTVMVKQFLIMITLHHSIRREGSIFRNRLSWLRYE